MTAASMLGASNGRRSAASFLSDLRRDATHNQSMCTRSRFECLLLRAALSHLKAVYLSDLTRDALDCASPDSYSFAAAVVQARRCFAPILLFSSLAPAAWSIAAITASVAV